MIQTLLLAKPKRNYQVCNAQLHMYLWVYHTNSTISSPDVRGLSAATGGFRL